MDEILFLAHRIPYPPDKGDKIRSWHTLRHLATRYRVHLGCLLDDPSDRVHIPFLRERVESLHIEEMDPRRQKALSLGALVRGEPLTFAYFRKAGLRRWVRRLLRERNLKFAFVFSSGVAPYVMEGGRDLPLVVDFVDADSEKWRQYAEEAKPPYSWLFAREGRLLARAEREIAERAVLNLLVTPPEVDLFRACTGITKQSVAAVGNGVDLTHFDPTTDWPSPFAQDEQSLVFTGAMDYRANVEAVSWFVREVLPLVRRRFPRVSFTIVGARPDPAVVELGELQGVRVTGRVDSVCPYLAHAAVVVAPLRVARGIQNKVLEAMAMARAVVATPEAREGIDASDGDELLLAGTPKAFANQIGRCLSDAELARRLGEAARLLVRHRYSWEARERELDRHLDRALPSGSPGGDKLALGWEPAA